ncbi:hypothetical protein JTE90_019614 [Oedothorax gibbosus]|uniref:Estradiol 17-beta-dehydrogenase 2 n=1 Tax=Oedothorax gibbosus TaxID=931172 RepID=A0AAV6V494_9ARAC|nr:hypothetical protein JTE90_019614 [Oedothorax gibbosus]
METRAKALTSHYTSCTLVLPNIVSWYYINVVNLVTVLLISKFTFTFTKRKFLNEKVNSAGRAVLITGCDTGFGHLLAKRLDSRGFRVFATCLFPTGDGAKKLQKSCSKCLEVLGLDVGSNDSVANALKYVEEHLGKSKLWAVVNNAGIQKGFSLDYSSIEDYQDSLNINTLGTIRVTKAFLPLLRKSEGRVVNVTSIVGRGISPLILAYFTSKFAAVGFNGCLRQELSIWGISVLSVEPEFFGTEILNIETCLARVNATIESTPREIRKEYGEAYEERIRSLARLVSTLASPKLNVVVNDLESAVVNLATVLLISKQTFIFTKRKFLNERIHSADRAVLITGCDTGFGHLLAKRLDSLGFRVFATCLFPTGDGAQELQKSCSKRLEVFGLDVGSNESVANARKYVEEHLGKSKLWAVVNNAGIQRGFSLDYSSIEDYEASLNINTLGMIRVTKAFLPLLRKSKGRVVNVTSLVGRCFMPMILAYFTSKFGAVGFNGCLRQELSIWGISVVSVEPEFFGTEFANKEIGLARLKATIESTPSDIRKEYGEAYEEKMQRLGRFMLMLPSPKVNLVVDDLELAVTAKDPDITYRPRRNMFTWFILFFYVSFPENIQDIIAKIFIYLQGLPNALGKK